MASLTPTIHYQGKKLSLEQATRKAKALLDEARYAPAEELARAIVEAAPLFDAGLQILGVALGEQGKYEEAVKYCAEAMAQHPDSPHQKNSLANYLTHTGELERAEQLYREALALSPGLPDATYNLGKLLVKLRRYAEAEHYLQQAVQMAANDPSVYYSLGICMYQAGNFNQAVLWFRLAHSLDPKNADIVYNIATCLQDCAQHEEAIEEYQQALELNPNFYDALLRMAMSHFARQRLDIAREFAENYLQHCPESESKDDLNALMMLSAVSKAKGKHSEAIEIEKRIIEKYPEINVNFSNLLLDMVYSDEYSQEELFSWCKKFAEIYEKPIFDPSYQHPNDPDPERKLRIGYVSADFFNHSVSYFTLPLIARHDKEKFEVFTYATRNVASYVTEQYKKETRWVPVLGMNDEDLAKRVQEDNIDILIDLSGHTGGNQLLAFAHKPAPVQVTWLGYPFSTGLSSIDYRLVDAIVEPEGMTEHLNTETLVRIPGMFCAYRPSINQPDRLLTGELDVRPTPAKQHGYITFGCCNNIAKVTDYTLQLWARVLEACPGAKLLIETVDTESPATRQALSTRFESNGVPMERVILSNRAKNKQYILYHDIDIVLDPFPCNGGTTSCDALFMSVPVVSLSGQRFMSRIGATVLTNIGHPEWVTDSPDEYVRIATDLASDIERLDQIRQNLRTEVENSPMMDEVGFTRKVERAYREMWRAWCAKQQGQEYIPQLNAPTGMETQARTFVAQTELEIAHDALSSLAAAGDWATLLTQSETALIQHPADMLIQQLQVMALLGLARTKQALSLANALYQQAPEHPAAKTALGCALLACHQEVEQAETLLWSAVAQPNCPDTARYALATRLVEQGAQLGLASPEANKCFNQALDLLQQALERNARQIHAWLGIAKLQAYRNRHNEAEVAIRQVLKQNPQHAEGNLLLATQLVRRHEFARAEHLLQPLLSHPEVGAAASSELARLYSQIGEQEKMLENCRRAAELQPKNLQLKSQLLWGLQRAGRADGEELAQHLRAYGEQFQPNAFLPHLNAPVLGRKLRIGLVSGNFQETDAINMQLPVFTLIDKAQFETFYYYNGYQYDSWIHRLKTQHADHWRFTHGISADVMVELVRQDEIDILIDLDGHQPLSFIEAFAYKPAPIQMRWTAQPDASGLSNIDYLLTDAILAPDNQLPANYQERAFSLPEQSYIVYQPFANHMERANMRPYQLQQPPRIQNGYITFGCFLNTPAALSPQMLAMFATLLETTPGAVLLVSPPSIVLTVAQAMSAQGIDGNRVKRLTTIGQLNSMEYYCQSVDILLDGFPDNNPYSTLHALWMGVPVVTLCADQPSTRTSASILHYLGHPEWIAHNEAQYQEIVRTLTNDTARLENLRTTLRTEMENSALTDGVSYTKALSAALTTMWETWCNSDAAAPARRHWQHQESLRLCGELMQAEQYDQAREGYMTILTQWPTCGESLYGLGLISLLRDEGAHSIGLLERAAQTLASTQHPLLADSMASLGRAYMLIGQAVAARACFEHSLTLQDSAAVRSWLDELGPMDSQATRH